MHCTCFAPVLSATSNQVLICIMAIPARSSSLRPGEHLDQTPVLGLRKRPRLGNPDDVALLGLALLIVGLETAVAAHVFAILGMPLEPLHLHHDRLLHLGGDDHAVDGNRSPDLRGCGRGGLDGGRFGAHASLPFGAATAPAVVAGEDRAISRSRITVFNRATCRRRVFSEPGFSTFSPLAW